MSVSLKMFAIVVDDYDRAIHYFINSVGLQLLEDTKLSSEKRWVRVGTQNGLNILLAKAMGPKQAATIGNQAGGRVGFFLHSDDFEKDYLRMLGLGVDFQEEPRLENYGQVVVFKDPYGNLWDLLGP